MFRKALGMQFWLLWNRKEFWISLLVMFSVALVVPILDAVRFFGADVHRLRPAYYYFLIFCGEKWSCLLLSAPLCICYVFADSFFTDRKQAVLCPILSRVPPRSYILSKLTAVGISSFLIVFVPVTVNMLVNLILFPAEGTVTYTGLPSYDENIVAFLGNILFPSLFMRRPYLYCVLFSCIMSVYYAMVSALVFAVSLFVRRARAWLVCGFFVLSFVFTNVVSRLRTVWPVNLDPNAYIIAFNSDGNKHIAYFIGLLVLIAAATLILLLRFFRKSQNEPLT